MGDINFFAATDYRNEGKVFGIKQEDRRLHMYIVGRTGMGKTSLLSNMILNDIYAGKGLCFLDPHGDAVERLLDYIPAHRLNEVIYLDPGDAQHPVPLNVLAKVEPRQKHLLVSGVISIFQKLYGQYWQHRQEHILRSALLALIEQPGPVSLLDVYRLLVDWRYRQEVVANVKDPIIWAFWNYEFPKHSLYSRSDAVPAILNKFGSFLTYPLVRNIIDQPANTFDFRDVMDTGKILLVNLAKGRLGEDVSSFLGSLIILKLQLAALSRIDTPENDRRDFYLFIDEFQSFLAEESLEQILSEARKYRLSLILAHQYINQLDVGLQRAVFGNVGTIIAFPVGPEDSLVLAKHFEPDFTAQDLTGNNKYHMYLRLAIDGKTSKPFSAVALPPFHQFTPQGSSSLVVQSARARYSVTGRGEVP